MSITHSIRVAQTNDRVLKVVCPRQDKASEILGNMSITHTQSFAQTKTLRAAHFKAVICLLLLQSRSKVHTGIKTSTKVTRSYPVIA